MPLNWNIEKCKDYKELTSEAEWPITDMLIWMTMVVGIPQITEKTAPEFLARARFLEKLTGTYLHEGGKPIYITREMVDRRIGLYTNASTLTRNKFNKKHIENWYKDNTLG